MLTDRAYAYVRAPDPETGFLLVLIEPLDDGYFAQTYGEAGEDRPGDSRTGESVESLVIAVEKQYGRPKWWAIPTTEGDAKRYALRHQSESQNRVPLG